MTNLRVKAISQTSSWILESRQSCEHLPERLTSETQSRLARVVEASRSACVMASNSGASWAAVASRTSMDGLSWTAAVVSSVRQSGQPPVRFRTHKR